MSQNQSLEDALKYEGDTMGHCVGGYCPDVLEGRSRIFSLRDAKGEPHVTIETEPPSQPYPVSGEAFAMLPQETKAQYGQYVREWRQRNPDIQNLTDEHTTQALKEAGVPPQPDDIIQIKGKGNARPISKYDPFTQDFVKSGNWGKVGDLHNTGLVDTTTTTANMEAKKLGLNIPRFLSKEESEALRDHFYAHQWEPETNPQVPEILKKYQDQTQPIKHSEDQISVVPKSIDPNPEGYAKGGRVKHKIHVSDDIDMMRHELMTKDGVQRFQVGGLAKGLAKGMSKLFSAVDKTAIELQRAKGTGAEFMTELSKKPGVKKAELADRNLDEIKALPKMTKDEFKAELAKRPVPQVTKKILSENNADKYYIEPVDPDMAMPRDPHWLYEENWQKVNEEPFMTRHDAQSYSQ